MDFRRLTAWSGLGFVVLILIGTFVTAAAPPSLDDSATKVAAFYADKHDQLIVGNIANTAATIVAVIFLAGVYSILRGSDEREPWALVGLVGAIVLAAVVTLGQAMSSLAILRSDVPGQAKFLSDLSIESFTLAGILIAVNLLGFSMAIRRSGGLPSWAAGLGLVTAAVGTIASFSAGTSNDVLNLLGFVAFLLFVLWVLLLSVALLRSTPAVS